MFEYFYNLANNQDTFVTTVFVLMIPAVIVFGFIAIGKAEKKAMIDEKIEKIEFRLECLENEK